MAQKYTPIWDDWFEVTQELNAQEKGRLIDAIVAYGNGGDWQEQIKGNERYVFPGYRARIDRYNEICGVRTASAKQNKPMQTKAKVSKTQQNANDNDNDKENDIKETTLKSSKEKRSRFSPPSVEDVTAYCRERKNGVDPQRFVDFYASKGWKIGSNPMKDWKAAVRTWEQRDARPVQAPVKQVRAAQYQQREYDEDDLEKRLGVNDIFSADWKGAS